MTWQCVGIVRLLVCLDITGQNNFPSRLKKKKKNEGYRLQSGGKHNSSLSRLMAPIVVVPVEVDVPFDHLF